MYEVTAFLRGTLAQGAVSAKHVRSVSRLAKYLQLSLAKRALLGGHRRKALAILSEVGLISYKPFTYIQILCLLAMPMCVTRFVAVINRRIRKTANQ